MKKYLLFLLMFLFVGKVHAFDITQMNEYKKETGFNGTSIQFSCETPETNSSTTSMTIPHKSCYKYFNKINLDDKYDYILIQTGFHTAISNYFRDYQYISETSRFYENSNVNFYVDTFDKLYITAEGTMDDNLSGVNYICTPTGDDHLWWICPNVKNISRLTIQLGGDIYMYGSYNTNWYGYRTGIVYNGIYLFNGSDKEIVNQLKETNKTIKDDDMSGGNQSADDFKNNNAFNDTTGIESIINLPLNFINSLSSTCQPLQLTLPWLDYPFEIPCLGDLFVSKVPTIANILKVVINGFIVYRILLGIVDLIHSAKNPDDDRIEVLDL